MSNVVGWSESKYWGFIRNVLRRGFTRYPNKHKALAKSKIGRNQYVCASCNEIFGKKDVAVDHIEPCGSLNNAADIGPFVTNMFCGVSGLQVLCKQCHYIKSLYDRGMSDEEILAIPFKKMSATEQRNCLLDMGVEPGKNADIRLKQYLENL